ncbi:alanine racemase [Zoogloea dura]|uniref:Alanine racemase n=1 Tax=Zoogloea dura TaxID=2728840 RepID=A0A848GC10_9RHOO|nr:alanine racemase [Zoogloea dura]NML28286.1 alanine racemase [Zoogloea dura]
MFLSSPFFSPDNAGAFLEVDLGAIQANWRLLRSRLEGAECAAVVKADAYGLGARQVAEALYRVGCRRFFVAHLGEGMALRLVLPSDAQIHVLHGVPAGCEADCLAHGLVPVLNSVAQLRAWQQLAGRQGRALPAILQVDTGMARLGLAADELAALVGAPGGLEGIVPRHLMSHLVAAEDPAEGINRLQLERFRQARSLLPGVKASLANSSGIFLGPEYHFDLARPGAALYGVAPVVGQANPMRAVIRLRARVIQTRRVPVGAGVGYGHAWQAQRPSRIATLAVGYADGYLRSLGNRGEVGFEGRRLPVIGKVSMDTLTVDVTDVPEGHLEEGGLVDVADPLGDVDAIASRAGTIGYEVLTSLGRRYARSYVGAEVEGGQQEGTLQKGE